jgi:putative inorganic carbon (HCO3(-)) transporter
MSVVGLRWQVLAAIIGCATASVPWLIISTPLAPLLVATGFVALLSALERPLVVCVGFVLFSLFRLHEAFPILLPLQLPLALAALTAVALACHALASRIEPVWPPEILYFIGFFVFVTLSSIYALNRGLAFEFWTAVYFKIGLMTLALAWLIRKKNDFLLFAQGMSLGGLLLAIVAISNKLSGTNLVEGTRVAISVDSNSPLRDPNELAFLLLMTLSFTMALSTGKVGKANRLLGAICVPPVLVAIVYTQSRGAVFGIVAIFAVYGLRFVRSKAVVLVVGVGVAVVFYLAMGISERMSGGRLSEGLDASAMSRLEFWIVASKAAIARPLTGVGLANFPVFNYSQTGQFMTTHNTLLQVLAETGFPGLILFVLMVVSAFRTSMRAERVLRATDLQSPVQPVAFALLASIAGFCAAGAFLSQGFTWSIYVIVAVAAAVGRYADETKMTTAQAEAPRLRDDFHDLASYRG